MSPTVLNNANWRKSLKAVGLAVAALLLLVITGLWLILGNQAAGRWALGQVPGLALDNFSGHLGGQWQAEHLSWQDGATLVEVDHPRLEWSPGCLFKLTLCIERLQAEQVRLQLAPAASTEQKQPLQLPDLKLPLALRLGDVRIGSLLLDGSEQLRDLQLAAHWTAAGLHIDNLHLQRDDLALDLAGLLQPSGQWPLQAKGLVRLPDVDARTWMLTLDVQGNLLQTLTLEGISSGYVQGRLSGELQPLADNLPAQLTLVADAFMAGAALPETLQLEQLKLQAKGDLAAGYEIGGTATLPAEQGPVSLKLDCRVDGRGAQVRALELDAGPKQRVTLSGTLDWQQALRADMRVNWLDFPWQRLYPVADQPQVTLRQFAGEISYTDGQYLGNFDARLDGPAGAFSVVSPFSGDLTQLFLPQLEMVAGQGKASGHLNLKFADGIGWDTALDLSAIDPAYWVAQLPGTLAGPLRSKGELKDDRLSLQADLDLKGRLRGQAAALQVKAEGAQGHWNVEALQVRLGDNRIDGDGRLDQRLLGQLTINLPRLGQLWPGLQGNAKGRVDLAGSLDAPQGS